MLIIGIYGIQWRGVLGDECDGKDGGIEVEIDIA